MLLSASFIFIFVVRQLGPFELTSNAITEQLICTRYHDDSRRRPLRVTVERWTTDDATTAAAAAPAPAGRLAGSRARDQLLRAQKTAERRGGGGAQWRPPRLPAHPGRHQTGTERV